MLLQNGDWYDWYFCDLQLQVAQTLRKCPKLADAYRATCDRKGSSPDRPWGLIIAFDEFTPGDQLRPDNRRKTMNVQANFIDLGMNMLRHEHTWFTFAVARHPIIASVVGGWSKMLSVLLESLFVGPRSIARAGIPLDIGDGYVLYAKLVNILSDMDGHKQAFDLKGAAGIRPCVKCSNIVATGSDLVGPAIHEIGCTDPAAFIETTRFDLDVGLEALRLAQARVAAKTMPKYQYEFLEKTFGLFYNPHGLLLNIALRRFVDLPDVITFDWMHCALADGSFSVDIWLLLKNCRAKLGMDWSDFDRIISADWHFPATKRVKAKSLGKLFSDVRCNSCDNADRLKFSASEIITMYSILRHFVELHLVSRAEVQEEVSAFRSACAVIDLILQAKASGVTAADLPARLLAAVCHNLQLVIATYGSDWLKPKHHYMMHIAYQIARDACVLDAFVLERSHLVVKMIANNLKKLAGFESSLLAVCQLHQESHLQTLELQDGLRGTQEYYALWGCDVATVMEKGGLRITAGDVVTTASGAGFVRGCLKVGDDLQLLISPMTFSRRLTPFSREWRCPLQAAQDVRWRADAVVKPMPVCWYRERDIVVVLDM